MLSDNRLSEIAGGVWHRSAGTIEVAEMVAELQRYRSARAADRERVRSVVREAVDAAYQWANSEASVIEHNGWHRIDPTIDWPSASQEETALAAIAARAADQLATTAVRLTTDEREQLEHHIRDHRATCSYTCSIIERLIAGAGQLASAAVRLSAEDVRLLAIIGRDIMEFGIGQAEDDRQHATTDDDCDLRDACKALIDRLVVSLPDPIISALRTILASDAPAGEVRAELQRMVDEHGGAK